MNGDLPVSSANLGNKNQLLDQQLCEIQHEYLGD
jgi:hypothetical protein